MTAIEGGCLCGKVRYRLERDGACTCVCHCRHCQKQSGSAFSIMLVAPKSSLLIEGNLQTYLDHGDSGAAVSRRFCGNCGSAILSELATTPPMIALKAGTLDDVSALTPQFHIWCSSAQPWVTLPHDVPCIPRQP